jgi:hypothetical protein
MRKWRSLSRDDEGIAGMVVGFAIIAIVSLIVMALAPEYFIVGIIVLFGLAIWFGIVKLGATPGQKMITKRTVLAGIVILLISIILATVILAGFISFEAVGGPPDLNEFKTMEYSKGGWEGEGTFTDGDENNELIDDRFYISSWTDTEESQKINMQGRMWQDGITHTLFDDAEYRVRLATGSEWGDPVKIPTGFSGGTIVTFNAKIFTLDTNFEGYVKVQLWVHFTGLAGGWAEMAYDCAQIESGKGMIEFVEGIYAVGEDAELELDLGYANGQYKLEVQALTTGEMLFDGFVDEDREGKISRMSFKVKSDHVGIGTWPDCPENLIEAKLWNELFPKNEHETAVTDIKTLGPQKPTIELSDPKDGEAYRTGEIISIKIEASPNIQTGAEIKEYRLHISPGDIVEENSDGSFTFQPPHRGTYKLMYSCQDAVCRRSEVVTKEIHVYDEDEDPPFMEGDFPWSIILILIAGLIGLFLTIAVAKDKKMGTTKALAFGLVVFAIIVLVGLYLTGGWMF